MYSYKIISKKGENKNRQQRNDSLKSFKLFIKDNHKLLIVIYIMTIVTVVLSFNISIKTKSFYNAFFDNLNRPDQVRLLLFLIFSYGIIFIFSVYSNILSHRVLYKGLLTVRKGMLQHILYTTFEYLNNNTVGKIWSETVSTTNEVCLFYYSLLLFPIDLTEVLVYGIIIFNSSRLGGFVIIAFLPINFIATVFSGRMIKKKGEERLQRFRELATCSVEMLSAVKQIKTTSSHDYFINKFSETHELMNDSDVKLSVINSYVDNIQNIIVILAPLIAVFTTSTILSANSLSVGELVILYTFSPLFFNAFRSLYSRLFKFFNVKPSRIAIENILSLKKEFFGSMPLEHDCKISVRNFNYTIGDKQISIPDFEINPGDKILITGESGLGKSTFFNCLVGIIEDHHNTIFLNGKDIKSYDLYQLRKKIILVSQEHFVFSGTLKENLLLGLSEGKNLPVDISEKGIQDVVKLLRIDELHERKHINNNKLSGGEKARINLGQALLRKPDVLLIDETLSSVDE